MKKWYDITSKDGEATILLYDEIGVWGVSAKEFIEDLNALKDISNITVRINSPGGDVFDGAAIYNSLRRHEATVTTHVDGLAASMATVIAMAGDKIIMSETAMFMIHNPSGGAYGESKDMIKYAALLDKVKSTMMTAYQSKVDLSDDELNAIMDDETWLTAEEALTFGFVDEISEPLKMAASLKKFDLTGFKHAPHQNKKEVTKLELSLGDTSKFFDKITETVANAINQNETVFSKQKDSNMEPKDKKSTVIVDKEKDEAIKAEGIQAGIKLEAERQNGITMAFDKLKDKGDFSLLKETVLKDPKITIEMAQIELLNAIGDLSESLSADPSIIVGMDSHEKLRDAGVASLQMRAGNEPVKGNNDLHGRTLSELARVCCEAGGVNISGRSRYDMIGIAMTTTSDFPFILENTANKQMQKGYLETEETWSTWTSKGTLTDFKLMNRPKLSAFEGLEIVQEDAEFTHAKFMEENEQTQLLTFGKLFNMSRQMIINDDLNAFMVVPQRMGRSARRKIGDLVYNILNTNPVMADGHQLFSAVHNNLAATGAVIDTATLDAARSKMKLQKDISGNANLGILPRYLITPIAVEGVAIEVINSKIRVDGDPNDPGRPNNIRNMAEVISESRLDGVSSTAWYLAASTMSTETIEVSFLDGNDAPFLDMQKGWTIDGVEAKVRIDATAKALEHRGLYMNPGA